MRKLTFVFTFVALVGLFSVANAQKIAHLNSNAILQLMPEKVKADEELKLLGDQKKTEIDKQTQVFQDLYKKYSEEAPKVSKEENEKRGKELEAKQEAIRNFQETAYKELEDKQKAKYDPILKKAQDSINKVAKAKGFEYVVDASQPGMLYLGGYDLMADVKADLGLK